jgi:DNA-binding NtrC family response regulator
VVSGRRAETFSLPASGEVVIGRGADCQIRIDDAALSRKHAVLDVGSELVLRDLGSANGCHIGGRHLAPHEAVKISPGVVILLGGATLVVQRGHASTRLRHVRSHDYFDARVEDECARAEAAAGMFTLARIRCRAQSSTQVEAALSRWLRPMDVVALYAPAQYELLLVDTAPEVGRQLCEAIVQELGSNALGLRVCSFPHDARDPDGLALHLVVANGAGDGESASAIHVGHLTPDLELIARGNISVLLLGETGVGKEVAANAIHRHSSRASAPLVSINCAAFSESLLESELFGYERGAFTGAHKSKVGLIESAHGGTLFLDEVGEMPPSLQVKLLRVLEQKEILRIGAVRPRVVDVRVIAATNRDLEAEVTRGAFRRDLFYRLAAETAVIAPLRSRLAEIVPLAERFIAHTCALGDGRPTPHLSRQARAILEAYAWPGNIRELRNVIERAVLLCRDGTIRPEHLPTEKMGRVLPPVIATAVLASAPRPTTGAASEDRLVRPRGADDRDSVVGALAQCAGNQTQAARLLGISRSTLVKRIEEFAVPRPRKADS